MKIASLLRKFTAAVVAAAVLVASIPLSENRDSPKQHETGALGQSLSPASRFEKLPAQEQAGSSFEENFERAKRCVVGLAVSREAKYGMGSGWITEENGELIIVTAMHTVRGNGFPKRIYLEQCEIDADGNDVLIEDGEVEVEYVAVHPSWSNDLVKLKIKSSDKGAKRLFRNALRVKLIDSFDMSPGERVFIMGYPYDRSDKKRIYEGEFIWPNGDSVYAQPRVTPGFSGGVILRITDKEVGLIGIVRGGVKSIKKEIEGGKEVEKEVVGNTIVGPGSHILSKEEQIPDAALSRFETYDEINLKDRKLSIHNLKIINGRAHCEVGIGQVVVCTEVKPADFVRVSGFYDKRVVCIIGNSKTSGKAHMLIANLSSLEEHYIEQIAAKIRSLDLEDLEIFTLCHQAELKDREDEEEKGKMLLGMDTLVLKHLKPLLVEPDKVNVIWNEDEKEEEIALTATSKFIRLLSYFKKPDDPTKPVSIGTLPWKKDHSPKPVHDSQVKPVKLVSILLFISAFTAIAAAMNPVWADTATHGAKHVSVLSWPVAAPLIMAFVPIMIAAQGLFGRGEENDPDRIEAAKIEKGVVGIIEGIEAYANSGYSPIIRDALKKAVSERASFKELLYILDEEATPERIRKNVIAGVIERLIGLALLKDSPDIQKQAVDRIVDISRGAAATIFRNEDLTKKMKGLAASRDIPRRSRAKLQLRVLEVACESGSMLNTATSAETLLLTIFDEKADNLEYEVLISIYNKRWPPVFGNPNREGKLYNAIELGIGDLLPEQIAGLPDNLNKKYANKIAEKLEVLCGDKDTATDAFGELVAFHEKYPRESLRSLASVCTKGALAAVRRQAQRKIIDLHITAPHGMRGPLWKNEYATDYEKFEVESLEYASTRFPRHDIPPHIKQAIEARVLPNDTRQALDRTHSATTTSAVGRKLTDIAQRAQGEGIYHASVALLLIDSSNSLRERLAVIEPLCILWNKFDLSKKVDASIRENIEGRLAMFALEDESKEVRSRATQALKGLGIRKVAQRTVLYLSTKRRGAKSAIDELERRLDLATSP